jgi:hypothetical protein
VNPEETYPAVGAPEMLPTDAGHGTVEASVTGGEGTAAFSGKLGSNSLGINPAHGMEQSSSNHSPHFKGEYHYYRS